ncbi:MAG: prephenate dehydratase [Nitrospinota bacterium]
MGKINYLRKKIDRIDKDILKLLNIRAEIAILIGEEKSRVKSNFHVPDREREIIEHLTRINRGPFPNDSLKSVYREILSATLSLERPLTISYLGPEATFTHLAAINQFGSSAVYVPMDRLDIIFSEVEAGRTDYGVVPIENSMEGVVTYTLDLFMDSNVNICGEILLEINHYLMSNCKNIRDIKKIYSHPQPLAQCRLWLEKNLPGISYHDAPSTAKAAKMAAGEKKAAAIASEAAAGLYGLNILAKKIEDNRDNYTRFLIIGKTKRKKSGNDKTSILVSIKDRVGALSHLLDPFAKNKINLTKIESRPLRKRAWEYVFYIDFEGHIEDKGVMRTIEKLKKEVLFLKTLGSYPKWS